MATSRQVWEARQELTVAIHEYLAAKGTRDQESAWAELIDARYALEHAVRQQERKRHVTEGGVGPSQTPASS